MHFHSFFRNFLFRKKRVPRVEWTKVCFIFSKCLWAKWFHFSAICCELFSEAFFSNIFIVWKLQIVLLSQLSATQTSNVAFSFLQIEKKSNEKNVCRSSVLWHLLCWPHVRRAPHSIACYCCLKKQSQQTAWQVPTNLTLFICGRNRYAPSDRPTDPPLSLIEYCVATHIAECFLLSDRSHSNQIRSEQFSSVRQSVAHNIRWKNNKQNDAHNNGTGCTAQNWGFIKAAMQ